MALSKITNLSITDDTIVNADINSSAAIALSKLASTPATLTGSTNNTVTTVTAANAISGEANLTFDGTDLTVSTGNVVMGTSGKGIDFSATAGAGTSELFDDYEEGTWSPALGNFGGTNESFIDPRYTKIGRLVFCSFQLQIGSFPSDGSSFLITGLPFTVLDGAGTTFGAVPFMSTRANMFGLTAGGNNTQMEMYSLTDGAGGQFNYNDYGQSENFSTCFFYEAD
jgi:hypothetical protein